MSLMRNFGISCSDTQPDKQQVIAQAIVKFNNLIKERALKDKELEEKALLEKIHMKYSEYIREVSIKK